MMNLLNAETPAVLDLGSDLHLRYQWFTPESLAHPAKLHLGLLSWILDTYTKPGDTVADCMAGIGSILYAASLQRNVIAREIEPRWLEIMHRNAAHIIGRAGMFAGSIDVGQADAREMWGFQADHIIFSPPYGNESAKGTDTKNWALPERLTRIDALRKREGIILSSRWEAFLKQPTPGSIGGYIFHYGSHPAQIGHFRGSTYLQAMSEIYQQARIALRTGGYLILITKDHIYQGKRVETAVATVQLCESLGFSLYEWHQRRVYPLSLWQRRRKEQGLLVVEEEDVLVFQRETVQPDMWESEAAI